MNVLTDCPRFCASFLCCVCWRKHMLCSGRSGYLGSFASAPLGTWKVRTLDLRFDKWKPVASNGRKIVLDYYRGRWSGKVLIFGTQYSLLNKVNISQNHNLPGFGGHLWRSSSATSLLNVGLLEQVAQDCVQLDEYLQRERFYNISMQPVAVFNHPHSKKRYFLVFRWDQGEANLLVLH